MSELAKFYGTVYLREYVTPPWSEVKLAGLTGEVSLVSSEDAFGFEVNSRDSTWAVVVSGKKSTVGIPGCQVKMIFRQDSEDQDFGLNPEIAEVP